MRKTSVPISSVLQLAGLDLGRVLPEARRLGLGQVAHDQPLQLGRARAAVGPRSASRRPGSGPSRTAREPAVERAQHRREVRVVADDLRQVRRSRSRSPAVAASPNQAFSSQTMYFGKCAHQPRSGAAGVDVVGERGSLLARAAACAGSPAAGRRAWGCRSSPGSRRGRAWRGRRRPGRPTLPSRSCRIAPARIICTPAGVLRPADRVAERRRPSRPELRDQRLGHLRGTARARCRRPARPSRACSASSAAAGSGRRSAGAASVVVAS